MDNVLENPLLARAKKLAGPLMRGFGSVAAPGIAAGFLVETLAKVSPEEIWNYVEQDTCLWDQVDELSRAKTYDLVKSVGGCDWLTVEWAIKAVRKELPKVCSLFLSSPKAHKWLEYQTKIIREALK